MSTAMIVEVTRAFPVSAQRVYQAWFDRENVGRWLFATPDGVMQDISIDARVGGQYGITEVREGEPVLHTGRYTALEPHRHIGFTLRVPKYAQHEEQVNVRITPQDHGCTLTLTHELHPDWAEWADQTREGWTGILDGLARTLA